MNTRTDLVPGEMRCAKCSFQLTRKVLAVDVGEVFAGDSKTEPCPNGCGPLWPVTWEQYAKQAWDACEVMTERALAAEEALKSLQKSMEGCVLVPKEPTVAGVLHRAVKEFDFDAVQAAFRQPVLFNPYTGTRRNIRDIETDPEGKLIQRPGYVLTEAAKR